MFRRHTHRALLLSLGILALVLNAVAGSGRHGAMPRERAERTAIALEICTPQGVVRPEPTRPPAEPAPMQPRFCCDLCGSANPPALAKPAPQTIHVDAGHAVAGLGPQPEPAGGRTSDVLTPLVPRGPPTLS